MTSRQRTIVAISAFFVCVAATQFAMRGVHQPTGNTGWLGTELAGVEALGTGTGSGLTASHVSNSIADLAAPTYAVWGRGPSATTQGYIGTAAQGVYGLAGCLDCVAVKGEGSGFASKGVHGVSNGVSAAGVHGDSSSGYGVAGYTTGGTGVYGNLAPGGGGHAGYFDGRVHVNGLLTKSAGTFKIDHPLEPATKYLSHSFVESPDMKNFYDGVVTLEADGTAVVELPEWFEALNKDFRYQLTCIGENAPIYIAEKIHDNRFRIAGGYAGMEVSWLVTGSRNDAYAKAYPIAVEEIKEPHEVGRFLHPELFGAGPEHRVGYDPRRAAADAAPPRRPSPMSPGKAR